jgi:hypothetical protein
MSGLIHITHQPPAWQRALRVLCPFAVLGGLAWYALSDEGLPIAQPTATTIAPPFVKAKPLPAPQPSATTTPTSDADTEALRAAAATLGTQDDSSEEEDYAARNAGIDTRGLSTARPMAVRTFLNEVLVAPGPQTGYVVAQVLPESRYERMGLRPGDIVYTLDTPGVAHADENSMVALMQQSELSLEVYRNGTLTRLHTNLATEDGDAAAR